MEPPNGIVRALLKTTLTEHLWTSFFLYYINLLEWEFCWYSDATADHLGERI